MPTICLRRLLTVALAIITVCFSATPAFAGEEEAKEYYSQAKDAYQAGEFAEAADLLERAYAEDPNLIYQYNRVLALQAMEEYEEALRVLDIYGNPMREDGRFDDIAEIRAQLEEAIAEQGDSGAPSSADTSDTDGEAAASGDATASDGTGGQTNQADSDISIDAETSTGATNTKRIVGWSLVGAGAAAAIVGFPYYTEIALNNKLDNDPSAVEDDVRARHQTISIITISSAAVLGGLGAYFLATSKSDGHASANSTDAKALFTPYATAEGGGGALLLRF